MLTSINATQEEIRMFQVVHISKYYGRFRLEDISFTKNYVRICETGPRQSFYEGEESMGIRGGSAGDKK